VFDCPGIEIEEFPSPAEVNRVSYAEKTVEPKAEKPFPSPREVKRLAFSTIFC